jgi:TPR repeat protein
MGRKAAFAFLAFLFVVSPAAAQPASAWRDDFREYYRALAHGDEPEMLRIALRLAEPRKGSHWATIVGDLYWQGRGTAANPAEAVKWYRRAAVRGGELAMLALARAYYRGKGTEQDVEAAIFWLWRAASHRQPRAILENTIYTRRGIPYVRDEVYAEQQVSQGIDILYQRARIAEESDVDAMPARRAAYVRAFRIFACPWAAPPDYDRALRFLTLAAEEGWADGAYYLIRFGTAHPALSSYCARE